MPRRCAATPASKDLFLGDPKTLDFYSQSRSSEEVNRVTSESGPYHTATQDFPGHSRTHDTVQNYPGIPDMQMIVQAFESEEQIKTSETCEQIASISTTTTVTTPTDFDTCPSPKSYDDDSIEQTCTII